MCGCWKTVPVAKRRGVAGEVKAVRRRVVDCVSVAEISALEEALVKLIEEKDRGRGMNRVERSEFEFESGMDGSIGMTRMTRPRERDFVHRGRPEARRTGCWWPRHACWLVASMGLFSCMSFSETLDGSACLLRHVASSLCMPVLVRPLTCSLPSTASPSAHLS